MKMGPRNGRKKQPPSFSRGEGGDGGIGSESDPEILTKNGAWREQQTAEERKKVVKKRPRRDFKSFIGR